MNISLMILMTLFAFVATAAEFQTYQCQDNDEACWRAVEKELTGPSRGQTPEQIRMRKRKLEELYKAGKLKEKPSPPLPPPPPTYDDVKNDPEALKKWEQRGDYQSALRYMTGYSGKRIEINLVKRFDDESQFRAHMAQNFSTQRKKHVQEEKDTEGRPIKFQFIAEDGKIINELSQVRRQISDDEQHQTKLALIEKTKKWRKKMKIESGALLESPENRAEKQLKHIDTVWTKWSAQENFLVEYQNFSARGEQSDIYDTFHGRTKLYDGTGGYLASLEGELDIKIAPNRAYLVALGWGELPDEHFAFYDMKGNLLREYEFETCVSGVVFSADGSYVGARTEHSPFTRLFTASGDILWTNKLSGSILTVTNNGYMLTDEGEWIDKSGKVLWDMEVKGSIQRDATLLNETNGLLLLARGLLEVVDLKSGALIERVPYENLGGLVSKIFPDSHLTVLGSIPKHEDQSISQAISLYKIGFKE